MYHVLPQLSASEYSSKGNTFTWINLSLISYQRKPIILFQPRESITRGIILPSSPHSLTNRIHLICDTHMKGKTLGRSKKDNCLSRTLQKRTLQDWQWRWFSKVSPDGRARAEEGPIALLIQEPLSAPKCGFSNTYSWPLAFCIAELLNSGSGFPVVGEAFW